LFFPIRLPASLYYLVFNHHSVHVRANRTRRIIVYRCVRRSVDAEGRHRLPLVAIERLPPVFGGNPACMGFVQSVQAKSIEGGSIMAKHLLLWRLNRESIPADPKERASGWGVLLEMVQKDIDSGLVKDWGAFPGENKGYSIAEGDNLDIMKMTQQYAPYVSFEIHPVASITELKELLLHMSK
jgi:hypothetical protein